MYISEKPSRYSADFSENMKQGEAGSMHSHDVLYWKEGKDFCKRRNLVTRDFCLVSKVKFPMERLRLASTVDVS